MRLDGIFKNIIKVAFSLMFLPHTAPGLFSPCTSSTFTTTAEKMIVVHSSFSCHGFLCVFPFLCIFESSHGIYIRTDEECKSITKCK